MEHQEQREREKDCRGIMFHSSASSILEDLTVEPLPPLSERCEAFYAQNVFVTAAGASRLLLESFERKVLWLEERGKRITGKS